METESLDAEEVVQEPQQFQEIKVTDEITLGSKKVRNTYIALIVILGFLLVLVIVGLFWAVYYAGYFASKSNPEEEEVETVNQNGSLTTVALSSSSSSSSSSSPSFSSSLSTTFITQTSSGERVRILASQLQNVGNITQRGISILFQGQGIANATRTKRFYLSVSGELFLDYRTDTDSVWQNCWRSDTANQDGFKFVLSSDGYGYILTAQGAKVGIGYQYREYLRKRSRGEILGPPIDENVNPWRTPNCRGMFWKDCNITKDNRTPPCLASPLLVKGLCYQSVITRPVYLRFSETPATTANPNLQEGLEIVSISEDNADPSSLASGVSSQFALYPDLKKNPKFPIPLWRVACPPLPSSSSSPLVNPVNLTSEESIGDCLKCTSVAT